MMGRKQKISVIISAYNSTKDLETCLESIRRFSADCDPEVIVVDNNSPDRSCLQLQDKFPWVHFFFLDSNKGFGAANNYGLDQASGEYILFLNPDTVFSEDSFSVGANYMDVHPSVGALSFMMLWPDGSPQYCYNKFPAVREELLVTFYLDVAAHRRLVRRDYEGQLSKGIPLNVDWVAGACLMTRRSVLNKVGRFDESFFVFFEDIDLCHRIRSAGWEIHYIPQTRITHIGGASTGVNSFFLVYQRNRSKYIYFRKQFGLMSRMLVFFLATLGLLLRIVATFLFRYNSGAEALARRRAYLRSVRIFLKGSVDE